MATTLRIADAADLPIISRLICERDGRFHPAEAIAGYLANLDHERIVVWIAERDGEPIGLNAIYLRPIACCTGVVRAGYWGHLYVRPEARKLMVYPQLVLTMLRWAKENELDWVYTATRQEAVAAAHLKLGFERIATIPVLLKPLRPGTLVAHRLGRNLVINALAAIADATWATGHAAGRMFAPTSTTGSSPTDAAVSAAAMIGSLAAVSGRSIRTAWTEQSWANRFTATIEGDCYRSFVVPATATPSAAALLRIAARGEPALRLAVVMDLVDASEDRRIASSLLARATDWALQQRADAIIVLEPTAPDEAAWYRRKGFMRSPERYALLVKSTSSRSLPDGFRDPARWRFPFAEHDAF